MTDITWKLYELDGIPIYKITNDIDNIDNKDISNLDVFKDRIKEFKDGDKVSFNNSFGGLMVGTIKGNFIDSGKWYWMIKFSEQQKCWVINSSQ